MKIVIAPQAFKGTISAIQAAEAMKEGVLQRFPDAEIVLAPIADGGDGTLDILMKSFSGDYLEASVVDSLDILKKAQWGFIRQKFLVVIESAKIFGLALLKPEQYNPLNTTTFGLGQMIHQILNLTPNPPDQFLIGLGDSATQDGGMGMLQALGVQFLDSKGLPSAVGGNALGKLKHIDISYLDSRLNNASFLIACDVNNCLLGPEGTTKTYASQKGATPEMIDILEEGMENYVRIVKRDLGIDIDIPFAGAAGGLGGAFFGFLHGQLCSGTDLILDTLQFDKLLEGADLVLTGEGCLDRQTAYNKGPVGVARRAKKKNIRVIAIVGKLGTGYEEALLQGIDKVIPLITEEKPAVQNTYSEIVQAIKFI